MPKETDDTETEPPVRPKSKVHLGAFFDERERLDPDEFAKDDFLGLLCKETFGKHGPLNTEEELGKMLASLPSSFPLLLSFGDEAIAGGEVQLDWFALWKVSESLYELADLVREQSSCSEVEALRAAHVIRIANLEWIITKVQVAMSEALDLLLSETLWDAMDVGLVSQILPPAPRSKMIKYLARQYEESLRRRNKKGKKGREALSSPHSWKLIVRAIKNHPSADPPPLGKFAKAMPRFERLDEKHAREALKKELAKLHREKFCPETDWRKLYIGIRSGQFPSHER